MFPTEKVVESYLDPLVRDKGLCFALIELLGQGRQDWASLGISLEKSSNYKFACYFYSFITGYTPVEAGQQLPHLRKNGTTVGLTEYGYKFLQENGYSILPTKLI